MDNVSDSNRHLAPFSVNYHYSNTVLLNYICLIKSLWLNYQSPRPRLERAIQRLELYVFPLYYRGILAPFLREPARLIVSKRYLLSRSATAEMYSLKQVLVLESNQPISFISPDSASCLTRTPLLFGVLFILISIINYEKINSSSIGECAGVEPASILQYRNPVFKHSHLYEQIVIILQVLVDSNHRPVVYNYRYFEQSIKPACISL